MIFLQSESLSAGRSLWQPPLGVELISIVYEYIVRADAAVFRLQICAETRVLHARAGSGER